MQIVSEVSWITTVAILLFGVKILRDLCQALSKNSRTVATLLREHETMLQDHEIRIKALEDA